jgi:hypothetical protein
MGIQNNTCIKKKNYIHEMPKFIEVRIWSKYKNVVLKKNVTVEVWETPLKILSYEAK